MQLPDLKWMRKPAILCIVPEPIKSNRGFTLLPETIGAIDCIFRKAKK